MASYDKRCCLIAGCVITFLIVSSNCTETKCCEYLTVAFRENVGNYQETTIYIVYTIGNGKINGKNYWVSRAGDDAIWFFGKETGMGWAMGEERFLGQTKQFPETNGTFVAGTFVAVSNTQCPQGEWNGMGNNGRIVWFVKCGWTWSSLEIFGFFIAALVCFIIFIILPVCKVTRSNASIARFKEFIHCNYSGDPFRACLDI